MKTILITLGILLLVAGSVSAQWSGSQTLEWELESKAFRTISVLEYQATRSLFITGVWTRFQGTNTYDLQGTYYMPPNNHIIYATIGNRFMEGDRTSYVSLTYSW